MRFSETSLAASLVVAACLLLANRGAFAGEPSPLSPPLPPSPQPSAGTLEAPAPATASHCIPAWVIDAAGTRQLPDRCIEDTVAPQIAVPAADDRCEQMWFVDAQG